MDTISGGRMELGIGAGWKRDEWLAYGYGFPETRSAWRARGRPRGDRRDAGAGEARTPPSTASTPRPGRDQPAEAVQQPRVPIMVGGNGPNVTWRLAARYADELNVDGMSPAEVRRGAADHPLALRGDRPRPDS